MIRHEKYYAGIGAGIVAGVVLGLQMTVVGFTPLNSGILGGEFLTIEWVLCLLYSGIVGVLYVWWFGKQNSTLRKSVFFGLLHGVIWWIFGALILRPLLFGIPIQLSSVLESVNMMFFLSHLSYGVILGNIFFKLTRNSLDI